MKIKIFKMNSGVTNLEREINEFIENKKVIFVKQSESACVAEIYGDTVGDYEITITIWYED